jgi:ADP-heptose:LPS heptosyltransferase
MKPYRIIIAGGLGDVLLTTPTIKALKEAEPRRKIYLYCMNVRQQGIFENNPHVDRLSNTSFFRNPLAFTKYALKWADFHTDFYAGLLPTAFSGKNAKDLIAGLHQLELKDDQVQIFLSEKEEQMARSVMGRYKDPIVMHITSKTSKNQEWELENWENLVKSMPDYTFLQLGISSEKKVSNAVDLRDQFSFRDTLALIKYAKSFVGVNSSFSHATNAFNIPGVVLFGPAQPAVWGHANNINLYKPVRCSPCLDLLFSSACPYEKKCMNNISVEEVRAALLRQVSQQSV